MGKKREEPLERVNFQCPDCRYRWQAAPEVIETDPGYEAHPHRYLAACPECGTMSDQAQWERALMKAWAESTGPKTDAGKAASAANLNGHPTPEESQITRFNSLKHGLYAKTTRYFPARPGKYQACEDCEYRAGACLDMVAKQGPCIKKTEIFMRHQIAYESKDPKLLNMLNMELQASVRGIVDEIILSITRRGVDFETPQWYYDKDGGFHLAEYTDEKTGEQRVLTEVQQHPLLKVLIDMMKNNGMTLPDHGMTPKIHDDQELTEGFLEGQTTDRESLLEHQTRQTAALEKLPELIERSQQRTRSDPVLIEHGSGDTHGDQ